MTSDPKSKGVDSTDELVKKVVENLKAKYLKSFFGGAFVVLGLCGFSAYTGAKIGIETAVAKQAESEILAARDQVRDEILPALEALELGLENGELVFNGTIKLQSSDVNTVTEINASGIKIRRAGSLRAALWCSDTSGDAEIRLHNEKGFLPYQIWVGESEDAEVSGGGPSEVAEEPRP